MKFFIKDFFSKCDQILENFIFYAVYSYFQFSMQLPPVNSHTVKIIVCTTLYKYFLCICNKKYRRCYDFAYQSFVANFS